MTGKVNVEEIALSFKRIIEQMSVRKIQGSISAKLTQLGLGWHRELCETLALDVAQRADQAGNTLEIDMEGPRYTQTTIEIYKRYP